MLALLLMTPNMAWAGLSRAELQTVSIRPPPGARLDPSLSAPDTGGARRSIGTLLQNRPGFINFVDYTCHTLCGTDLMLLADGIQRAGLRPQDVHIIVIGLDPKDTPQSALNMERHWVPDSMRQATTFLLPDQATIAKATSELGFHYVYDTASDQFAHPAVVYAVAPDGSLKAALSPLALTASDLRQVLQTEPLKALSLYQRIRSICYGYDPVTGLYTPNITFVLKVAALATILSLAIGVAILAAKRRQRP